MAAFKVGSNLRVLIGSFSYGGGGGHYGLKGIENLVLMVSSTSVPISRQEMMRDSVCKRSTLSLCECKRNKRENCCLYVHTPQV